MGNGRDRFGDKLRDKEKADEDRYFAERDRELLRKMKEKAAEDGDGGNADNDADSNDGDS